MTVATGAGREFRSRLEDLMPAVELDLEPTPGFGRWAKFFPREAVAHPAKANLNLISFLVEKFTAPGDVVLDPLAGTYSTCVLAALSGRTGVGIELEDRFYRWGLEAKRLVEGVPTLLPKGTMVVLKGDARRLSELLGRADVAITSPPYAETYLGGGDAEKRKERLARAGYDPKEFLGGRARNAVLRHYGEVDVCITSPPYADGFKHNPQNAEKRIQKLMEVEKKAVENGQKWAVSSEDAIRRRYAQQDLGYGQSKENIGNLPLGNVDAVITSPPYSEGIGHDSGDNASEEYKERLEMQRKYARQMTSEGNIAKLKHGEIDAVITSPNKGNIGSLPLGSVDAVITSPPYEGSLEGTTRHTRGGMASRDPALARGGGFATTLSRATKQGVPVGYSPDRGNIGNLKSKDEEYEALTKGLMKNGKPTYLSEMLMVYAEMHKVLKPGGRAIIIVKPFIRGKKPVDLPYHSHILLSRCGFVLEKLYKLRLRTQSFWRILYARKFPNVPCINHEYVLIYRKPFK